MATTSHLGMQFTVIPRQPAVTNFTTLADYREHFAETIIECHDLALKTAPRAGLITCLVTAAAHAGRTDPAAPDRPL